MLNPYEFEKAKNGSLFVKKGDELVAISIEELTKPLKERIEKIESNEQKVDDLKKYTSHYQKLAKSHFIVVFSHFIHKVMLGQIVIDDVELFNLDEKVINGDLSVEEALKKHEYLQKTFDKLFNDNNDKVEYPAI